MRLDILTPPFDSVDAERMNRFQVGDPDPDYVPLHSVALIVRHHPDLAEGMRQTAWLFLDPERSSLDLPTRELAVARITVRCRCEYQWGIHQAVFGEAAGFTPAKRAAVVHGGPDDPIWDERERDLLRAVDEVIATSTLQDKTWDALLTHLSPQQALELIALIGWYQLNSYLSNAVQLPLEAFAARFPSAPDSSN